jgi:hypothetical protein
LTPTSFLPQSLCGTTAPSTPTRSVILNLPSSKTPPVINPFKLNPLAHKAFRSWPNSASAIWASRCQAPLPDISAKDGRTGGIPGAHVHVEPVLKTGIHAGFEYGSLPRANSTIRLRRTAVETAASMPPQSGSTTAGNSIYIRPVTPPVRPLLPLIGEGWAWLFPIALSSLSEFGGSASLTHR